MIASFRWCPPLIVAASFLLVPAPPGDVVPPYARAGAGAPPLAAGVHAPNRPWRDADFARVAQGQFGFVKMMSYHPPESYARLRQALPRVQFAVRLDTPWNELPPPDQFAATNAPYLRKLVQAGYQPWVEIGNEPNLELHPAAEAAFVDWYGEVLDRLRAAVPEAKYGFPGLAQDRQEDAWLAAAAPAIERSDWLGIHAYWRSAREMLDPGHALWLVHVHERFPTLPLLVTEAGNDAPGATAAERADEYARFTRTLARLPYVRAVDFFILSGTPEWQRFFFNDQMTAALRDASHDPVPVLDGLRQTGRTVAAAVRRRLAAGSRPATPKPPAPPTTPPAPTPSPTPLPSGRRRLLADPAPDAARRDRWLPLCVPATDPESGTFGGPAACALRTASAYLATDFSAWLDLAAPAAGAPAAVQIAEEDLLDGVASGQWPVATGGKAGALPTGSHDTPADDRPTAARRDIPNAPDSSLGSGLALPPTSGSARATGFVLLWDGEQWRLQYRRDGAIAVDQPFQPAAIEAGGRYQVEVALEKRSAAAWVWPRGEAQPPQPNAVFAPPEPAVLDGARPRALFIPAAAQNVILEGATRD